MSGKENLLPASTYSNRENVTTDIKKTITLKETTKNTNNQTLAQKAGLKSNLKAVDKKSDEKEIIVEKKKTFEELNLPPTSPVRFEAKSVVEVSVRSPTSIAEEVYKSTHDTFHIHHRELKQKEIAPLSRFSDNVDIKQCKKEVEKLKHKLKTIKQQKNTKSNQLSLLRKNVSEKIEATKALEKTVNQAIVDDELEAYKKELKEHEEMCTELMELISGANESGMKHMEQMEQLEEKIIECLNKLSETKYEISELENGSK